MIGLNLNIQQIVQLIVCRYISASLRQYMVINFGTPNGVVNIQCTESGCIRIHNDVIESFTFV